MVNAPGEKEVTEGRSLKQTNEKHSLKKRTGELRGG